MGEPTMVLLQRDEKQKLAKLKRKTRSLRGRQLFSLNFHICNARPCILGNWMQGVQPSFACLTEAGGAPITQVSHAAANAHESAAGAEEP